MEEMNEVTEFMSKFDQDTVEVKWGLGTDDSLGTKVKITLLASGFGLQNVPLMESAHGGRVMREPDEDRLRREEEEEEKANRRSTYYNEDDKKPTKPRRYVYIFTDDVLDNDDLISMVESTPTVDRNKNELKQIQEKAASEQTATETVDNEADNSQTFTIQF